MKNKIQTIYDQANFILDNDINYQNCKINYILENPKTDEVLLMASDGNEVAIEFKLKNGKLDYYNVPEWDYNFDYYYLNSYFAFDYSFPYLVNYYCLHNFGHYYLYYNLFLSVS